MPDFSQLLSAPVDSFDKPKPLPAGTYYGRITTFKVDEVQNEKKTPYVRLNLVLDSAGEDIDPSLLSGTDDSGKTWSIDLTKKPVHIDYYLTPDSQYRIRELMEDLGMVITGRSLNETLPELQGQAVLIAMTQKPSRDGTQLYTNVDKITAHK